MSNLQNFLAHTHIHGGASFNLVTGELNPSTGFMVAIKGHELIVSDLNQNLQNVIANYIKDKAIILLGGVTGNDKFIGSWINDGKLYLDVSVNYSDKSEALQVAAASGELAIYDCVNNVSITL